MTGWSSTVTVLTRQLGHTLDLVHVDVNQTGLGDTILCGAIAVACRL